MEVVQIPHEAWRPILEAYGFKIRQDGLICSVLPLATDTKEVLTPIKCYYCRSVLHLRNINVLEANKAACKDIVCQLEYSWDQPEEK